MQRFRFKFITGFQTSIVSYIKPKLDCEILQIYDKHPKATATKPENMTIELAGNKDRYKIGAL